MITPSLTLCVETSSCLAELSLEPRLDIQDVARESASRFVPGGHRA